jgi:hypothetical protein
MKEGIKKKEKRKKKERRNKVTPSYS